MTNFGGFELPEMPDLSLPGYLETNDVDMRLHAIVDVVEGLMAGGTEIRIPCHLVVDGAVVEGEIVAKATWAKKVAEKAEGVAAKALMQAFTSDADVFADDEVFQNDDGHRDYYRVHLLTAGGRGWRIRTKNISAWSLGV